MRTTDVFLLWHLGHWRRRLLFESLEEFMELDLIAAHRDSVTDGASYGVDVGRTDGAHVLFTQPFWGPVIGQGCSQFANAVLALLRGPKARLSL
jgi:hypothetical protein